MSADKQDQWMPWRDGQKSGRCTVASARNFGSTQVAFGSLIGLDRLNETGTGRSNAACCRSWIIVICSYNLQAILSGWLRRACCQQHFGRGLRD